MVKKPLRRPSYKKGLEWIAENDEPGQVNPQIVSESISVLLLADLFCREPFDVAISVVKRRKERDKPQ